MHWRLVDESGEEMGELKGADASWGYGDTVVSEGRDLEVVGVQIVTPPDLEDRRPKLVVRVLNADPR